MITDVYYSMTDTVFVDNNVQNVSADREFGIVVGSMWSK